MEDGVVINVRDVPLKPVRGGDSGNTVGDNATDVIFSGDKTSEDNAIDWSAIGASGDNEPDSRQNRIERR